MSDRGRLSGCSWHHEFHTVNQKKEKAADCIYLTKDRVCQNKKSFYYLSKCFTASCCPLRKKEHGKEEHHTTRCTKKKPPLKPAPITLKKTVQIKNLKCTLPMGCKICSESFGQGKLVGYDKVAMHISVQFAEKVMHFQYPDAIFKKFITLSEELLERVKDDVANAEVG